MAILFNKILKFVFGVSLFRNLLIFEENWINWSKMPPHVASAVEETGVLNECDAETVDGGLNKNIVELKHANARKIQLVWRNIILFIYVHFAAVYGAYLMFTSARLYTVIFGNLFLFSCFYMFIKILSIEMNSFIRSVGK